MGNSSTTPALLVSTGPAPPEWLRQINLQRADNTINPLMAKEQRFKVPLS